MTNRLDSTFERLRAHRQKALIAYVMAGDPSLPETEALVLELERAGADIIELGVPFSDPIADGPVIQKAAERALRSGTSLRRILPAVSALRAKTQIPLVLNERGKPYERTGLYRRVVRILTEAGLGSRASVQLLRHTYGYLAYKRSGGNLLFVQRQLGHAHPLVTSIYAQFVDEPYARLADAVGGSSTGGPAQERSFRSKRFIRSKGN